MYVCIHPHTRFQNREILLWQTGNVSSIQSLRLQAFYKLRYPQYTVSSSGILPGQRQCTCWYKGSVGQGQGSSGFIVELLPPPPPPPPSSFLNVAAATTLPQPDELSTTINILLPPLPSHNCHLLTKPKYSCIIKYDHMQQVVESTQMSLIAK